MKTFAIMFGILSIVNMPVYYLYENSTENNNYSNIGMFFKYFTLGNIGQDLNECGWSEIDVTDFDKIPTLKKVNITCPEG
jgi:hypothetical protein